MERTRRPAGEAPGALDHAVRGALGGPLGIAETAVPAAVFAVTYSFGGTSIAAVAAVVVAVAFGGARVVGRTTPRHAVAGVAGVALAALVAARTGKAENFYLPGLLLNAVYATACGASVATRRPFVGYVVAAVDKDWARWREDEGRSRASTGASLMWAAVFAARLAVQVPLYLCGAVVALGLARTVMGVPLFALGIWATYRLVERART